jgi:hypothetical protein
VKILGRGNRLIVGSMVVVTAVALTALSACGTSGQQQASNEQTTSSRDWDPVGQAIGKDGKLMKGDVYRIDLPRSDLKVTSQGVDIRPALSYGIRLKSFRNVMPPAATNGSW